MRHVRYETQTCKLVWSVHKLTEDFQEPATNKSSDLQLDAQSFVGALFASRG